MKPLTFVLSVAVLLLVTPCSLADPGATSDPSEQIDETVESSADLLRSPDGEYEISVEEDEQEQSTEMQQVSQDVNTERSVPVGDIVPGLSLPDGFVIRGMRQGGVGIGVELLD